MSFIAIANSSQTQTVVVSGSTYYHYNPWYRAVVYEGEQAYLQVSAPVGYEVEQLPEAERVEVDGKTYFYAEGAFYADQGEKFAVVEPPVGAEVSSVPKEASNPNEQESDLFQFDTTFFTKTTNDAGKEVYRVEPSPPEEELKEIPQGSPSFVADGETYYYVNYNLYVRYEEDGKSGFINGEPEIGAQLDKLPEGTTTIEEDGRTFHQFDMVFFEEVQDESGTAFYEVVGSPDGSEAVDLNLNSAVGN